jgi:hypothetical protein
MRIVSLLALSLAGCTMPVRDPPAFSSTPAEAQCKVMFDQALISARGYSDAQVAKQLYWDCLQAKAPR